MLIAADQRIGIERLQKHFQDCEQSLVLKVLAVQRLLGHS